VSQPAKISTCFTKVIQATEVSIL